ncbi:MAG: hypothetical protein EXQ56_10225 [Acidobacteria bacterium]|nr:hypothetical protein [Acidobacteriota bacterium]
MGFIAYQELVEDSSPPGVRIFMECQQQDSSISYSYAVNVVFSPGKLGCALSGVDDILALKKFYKLVFSLEERARERGHDWKVVFESKDSLLEHLGYTRNARLLGADAHLQRRPATDVAAS